MSSLKDLLVEFDAIHGVSGDEERVAQALQAHLKPVTDEHFEDALGNQVFIKKGSNPDFKVMLATHMDEIGYIVHNIDSQGFVYILPVGYHDNRTAFNQVLTIYTEKGPVTGITGGKPAHIVTPEEAKLAIPIEELYIDVGTTSKEETLALGVQIGDYLTFQRTGQFLNDGKIFTGKAVDNRAACAVMVEAMKRLADKNIVPTVYGVGTVQEEMGIRGSVPISNRIQPDIGLALDVCLSGGTPALTEKDVAVTLGGGPALMLYDWTPSTGHGNNVPKKLTRKLIQAAEKNNIPYQREVVLNGGTDAWAMSVAGNGALASCISFPSRNIHSATGCVHIDDLEYSVQLIVAFIEALQEKI
ncbi:M42 family metallopeptidase [Pseudobacillus sp. FSL P4-0506]|uniref:M42 family metallopeptidase n=1 Tax=Pseudobacillus sp. FSL P4-0506 TaxID=2921576 RepID=UPI0030F53062